MKVAGNNIMIFTNIKMKKRFLISAIPLILFMTDELKDEVIKSIVGLSTIVDTQNNTEYKPSWGSIDNPLNWRKIENLKINI